jgi:7-dehydrocholesterol reductase
MRGKPPEIRCWIRYTILPALLIILSPPATILIWYTNVVHNGSLAALADEFARSGILITIARAWGPIFFGSRIAWTMIGVYAGVELSLMKLLPGRIFYGPVTPGGNIPVYKANGPLAFVVTVVLYAGGSVGLGLFPPSIIYDHFGELLGALNLFSLVFCLLLCLKGRLSPSSSDHGGNGKFIVDYFWGTELHPRILGWDIKMFTNCRFGLMGWPLILLSFVAAQHAKYGYVTNSMLVATGIQFLYVAKFFWWETGYLRSIDMMHDRAGFYICWGCLVWVPCVYTASTLYLVHHPQFLGAPLAALIFVTGIVCISINYLADEQRQRVRETAGKTMVWGKPPVLLIGRYTTARGEQKQNLLLASGWWGLSRHFHYVPELLGAFCWTVPVLFENVLPYFYLIFLTVLLTDRAFRVDKRCAAKYGSDWEAYRRAVPYRIIPGLI